MVKHEKDSLHGELYEVSVPLDVYRAVDFLARQLELGNRLWGGGVGCRRCERGAGFEVTYVGDWGEPAQEPHPSAKAAVWAYLARAEVGLVNVTIIGGVG